jgi:uncharacterized membrane protein
VVTQAVSDARHGPRQAVEAPEPGAHRRRSAHSVLVVAPIACWSAGLVLDVASRFGPDPALLVRTATWLMGIGLLTAVVAGLAGMAAGAPIPTGTTTFRRLLLHLGLVLATLVFLTFAFLQRLATQHGEPAAVSTILLSAGGVLLALAAGSFGRTVRQLRRS